MCRFALYLGEPITMSSLVSEPAHSILNQSFDSKERHEPLNGDGFGVTWYAKGAEGPTLFKEVSPAWSSFNLLQLAPVTRSSCILAHVRAATPGLPVAQYNCHPFSSRQLTFMHNGEWAGFRKLKQRVIGDLSEAAFNGIAGSTDSEHLFAVVRDRWPQTSGSAVDRMASALRLAIEYAESLRASLSESRGSTFNLALTDGQTAVVTRFVSQEEEANSLYLHRGSRYLCEGGLCRMIEPPEGQGAVLVTSEPLSHDPGWEAVPVNHLVKVERDLTTRIEAI